MKARHVILLSLVAPLAVAARPVFKADAPKECDSCAEWNVPQEPFRVFGNTYYVGVTGLGSVLVTSDQGLILLDGGLPQSAPLIDANIRKLGFRTEDVRLIVNSHAHFDHAGGIAALQRASGATVAASAWGARAIENGAPPADDPQYVVGTANAAFPAVKRVRVVTDGEILRVGPLAITAHLTPGHTPGSTSWTWRSCEGARCLGIVYADSLNPVSAPGFRFSGDGTHPSIEAAFRRSIGTVAGLPCDILLAVHPSFMGMADKLRRLRESPGSEPFVESGACRTYAGDAERRLDQRIAEEQKASAPAATRGSGREKVPAFDDYSVGERAPATLTPADVRSGAEAHRYRTVLRRSDREPPNFAGHFTIVTIGCGTSCARLAVVDRSSGRVYFPAELGALHSSMYDADYGYRFVVGSRLIRGCGDPAESGRPACRYYEWTGESARLLTEVPWTERRRAR